jgi:hypothetical protein
MADITPITREEFYLAKAGGQDVPVPSAVTREEYYLEKLTNDSVAVPTPVTRREKFLYFASGGEIDLPSEEKMTRLERLIAKAGGMDVSTPTAVTRLEKFWANVEAGGWKTITGVLPLTFTAKGGTAVDWVIYGNDDVGERTRNLFDCRKNNNNYTDVTVAGVRFLYENQSIKLSQTSNNMYPQQQIKGENGILTLTKNTQYYGRLYLDNAPENANIYMKIQASTDGTSYTTITTIRSAWVMFTPSDDYTVYRWLFVAEGDGITYNNTVVRFAIIKGSTAPDHYIPYGYQIPLTVSQQGQTDKNYDIYIGDSPLTEGETVSKTSTGVDIELFEGENTVSTTLYNKPAMEIKYK